MCGYQGGTDLQCGGNYAASIAAQVKAEKLGYTQVLWLDEKESMVEEVGTMNVMFKIDIGKSLRHPVMEQYCRVLPEIPFWEMPVNLLGL